MSKNLRRWIVAVLIALSIVGLVWIAAMSPLVAPALVLLLTLLFIAEYW